MVRAVRGKFFNMGDPLSSVSSSDITLVRASSAKLAMSVSVLKSEALSEVSGERKGEDRTSSPVLLHHIQKNVHRLRPNLQTKFLTKHGGIT